MSQQTAAIAVESPDASNLVPAIGTVIQGGYFAGLIMVDGVRYGTVMAGAAGELSGRWNSDNNGVGGALSRNDGAANTLAMSAAGSKLAARALALDINGFTDWYIPSRDELELAYRHFKPSVTNNWQGEGSNPSSAPFGEPYTAAFPAQTAVAALIEDEADALVPAWYWSSTQCAAYPTDAWYQYFDGGYQDGTHESYAGRARAFRRFVI